MLANMGGAGEARFDGLAESWDHAVPAFNTLAVDCVAAPDAALLPRVPGLPDALFQHDGTMTKQEVRAATLAKLMPMRGALLWDIGTGCGSVAVEWMRGARYARAIGIEPRADRRAMAAANALALGAPKLELIDGRVPEALDGLAQPDAVFHRRRSQPRDVRGRLGGAAPAGAAGVQCRHAGKRGAASGALQGAGRATGEAQVNRAEPVGSMTGWRPLMPVTQWSLVKR